MQVDLSRWMNSDKNGKFRSELFMGTMIMPLGQLKGYTVQIIFPDLAIPSRVVQTQDEAKQIEREVWETMCMGDGK